MEGNWTWQTTGSVASYTRFASGYPSGGTSANCLAMWQENGNWVDSNCLASLSFHVCEKSTATPTAPAPIFESIHNNLPLIKFWCQ
jgi:hypothetical protein